MKKDEKKNYVITCYLGSRVTLHWEGRLTKDAAIKRAKEMHKGRFADVTYLTEGNKKIKEFK